MQKIPIFPLNVVVFPGMPVPLHIFEDRYKEMINECVELERPFGMVLIREGRAEGDIHVQPYAIGCTVQISQVERLADGRLFIMAQGKDRFRLRKLDRSNRSFFTGEVEYLHLNEEVADKAAKTANLRDLVRQYLDILQTAGDIDFDLNQIPTEATSLVYIAASLLNVENRKKQRLLENNQLSKLLDYLQRTFAKELNLLRLMPKGDSGAFSVN